MNYRAIMLAGVAASVLFSGGQAFAEDNSNIIEELVITAEKREQNLQDVPVAISAFTARQRDIVGINSIQDLTNFTPGFVYQSANDRASMRGVGRLTNVHAVDGAVSIYVDGLFTTSTVLAGGPPLMTDRVEILRGPQGTLYGRNAIGGAVNVISVRPTKEPYAEVRAVFENFGYTDFQLAASGPIAEGLSFRVAGYKKNQREGYFQNVNPGRPSEGSQRDEYELQFQLQAELGERADFWMNFRTLGWDNRGGPGARASYINAPYEIGLLDPGKGAIFNPAYGYTAGIVPGSLVQAGGGTTTFNPAYGLNGQNGDPRKFNTNFAQSVRLTDVKSLTVNFTYHFDDFDVKYVGGRQNYKYDLRTDFDTTNILSYQIPLQAGSVCGTIAAKFAAGQSTVNCGPLTVNADERVHYYEYPTWFSHEVDIASTGDGPLQWIVGAFYYNEQYSGTNGANIALAGPSSLQTPILGAAANPNGNWLISEYFLTTESKALFGQIDWQLTDTFKVTAGLRYTEDHKSGYEQRRIICNSNACYASLYPGLGLSSLGPGTAANWGSLLGNLNALPAVGQALGLGNALAGLAGRGNGGMDISSKPTTTSAGAKGVPTTPTCTTSSAGVTTCTQYTIDPATGVVQRQLDDTSDAVTGTLGVQWEPNDDYMAYARYSRGYKAFGFNAGGMLVEPEARPEFVNAYEVGLKANFLANLQVNTALYYLDYRDLQAPVSVRVGPTTVSQFTNIAKSVSQGVELGVIWQPVRPLRLTMDYAYNDTEIKESILLVDVVDTVNTGAVSVVGNRLPQAPRNKFSLNATYTFETDAGDLSLGASYLYRDEAYANVFTKKWNEAPSWDQVDLRAHWASASNRYTVIAYVKNVGDTAGYDAAVAGAQRSAPATGAQILELTPPRTYGVELQYRF